jgi:uncharacterized protein (DUF58 family)
MGNNGIAIDIDHLIGLRAVARDGARPRSAQGARKRAGRGLEPFDRRPYVEGDDIRHIDWRASARTGLRHVKLFAEERERTVVIAVDLRPSMIFGARRALRAYAAVEFAALAAWCVRDARGRLGLAALTARDSTMRAPRVGERAVLEQLGDLARAEVAALASLGEADPPLDDFLQEAARLVPNGGQLLLVSAFESLGDDFFSLLAGLTPRIDALCIRSRDAPPGTRPPPGLYRWRHGARATATLLRGKAAKRLGEELTERGLTLDSRLAAAGARIGHLDAWLPPLEAFAQAWHGAEIAA